MKISLRIISLLMSLLLALSLFACNSDEAAEENSETEEITETEKPTKKRSTTRTETATVEPMLQTVPELDLPDGIKNIILIIGDGMGQEHVKAGQLNEGTTYDFTSWNHTLCNTDSRSSSVTDSAAAATALATGTLTFNGYVGKNTYGWDYYTILDVAQSAGKSTGIVTTDYLYEGTPAGFSAHSSTRNSETTIVASQLDSGINFMLGRRDDGAYSRKTVTEKGYFYDISTSNKEKIMESEKVLLNADIENGKEVSITLKEASNLAIEFLERDNDGFVLMIEQGFIDDYSHSNKIDKMLDRMASLNETVEAVMEWVGDRTDTAVIVTADHECGGLSVSAEEEYENAYVGGQTTIYYQWTSVHHTKALVDVYVYGVDFDFLIISEFETAEKIKNTDIFKLMYGLIVASQ